MKHLNIHIRPQFRRKWFTFALVWWIAGICSCESAPKINRSGSSNGIADSSGSPDSSREGSSDGSSLKDTLKTIADSTIADSSSVGDSANTDSSSANVSDASSADSSGTDANQDSSGTELPRHYTYRIIESYPHDHNAFTQGLIVQDSILYESTGLYGKSSLRKVSLTTGEVLQQIDLDASLFGEGLTVVGDRLIQLTWKSLTGFVYDKESFVQKRTFSYATEGWGITHDGQDLIMSTGSSTLFFRNPDSFEETRRLDVSDNGIPVTDLNELEYVEGEIYANVWGSDRIAIISPKTGSVTGWVDLTGIISSQERADPGAVLNGIAYDDKNKRLIVTGKLWPYLFEIELVPSN